MQRSNSYSDVKNIDHSITSLNGNVMVILMVKLVLVYK